MPIYRGDRKIASVYRGDRKIVKIYRGDRVVYSAKKRVLLFDNVYKAVYIGTSTNFNILFNATPNFDPALRKYEFTYNGILQIVFYLQSLGTTSIGYSRIRLGGNTNNVSLPRDNNINKIVINKDKLYINDAFVQDLVIGETLDTATEQKIGIATDLKFYEMKIYDNDVLVYHFVPAYRKLIGISEQYGIAELVSETFVNDYRLIGEPEYEE